MFIHMNINIDLVLQPYLCLGGGGVCVFTGTGTIAHADTCESRRLRFVCYSVIVFPYFWRQVSSLNWSSHFQLYSLACELLGINFILPIMGSLMGIVTPNFYMLEK